MRLRKNLMRLFVNSGKNFKQSIPVESIIYPNDVEMSIKMLSVSAKRIIDFLPQKTSGEVEINNIVEKAT